MPRITVVPARESVASRCLDSAARLPDVEVATWADAAGDFVLLLDEDCDLLPQGLAALADSLERTASDAAVGTGAGAVAPAGPLNAPAESVTVHGLPALLSHAEASSVLWRRSRCQGEPWPADPALRRGTLARRLLAAASIDVVPEAVVSRQVPRWPARRVRRSVRTTEVPALLTGLADLVAVTAELGDDALRREWFGSVLQPALLGAFGALAEATPAEREQLVESAAAALDGVGPGIWMSGRAITTLQLHLAAGRKVRELMAALAFERSGEIGQHRPVRDGADLVADLPFRDDAATAVPGEVFLLDADLVVRSRVDRVSWSGDLLTVAGYAHIALLDVTAPGDDVLELDLVRTADRRRVPLTVERTHRPDVTREAREAAFCYDGAGFRATVDVRALRDDGRWTYGTWRLEATVTCDGVRRNRLVTATSPGAVRHAALHDVGNARIATVTGRGTFTVEVDTLPVLVTRTEVRDGVLRISGALRRAPARGPAELQVVRASGLVALSVPLTLTGIRRRGFTADVPLELLRARADAEQGEASWTVRASLPGTAKPVPVRVATDLEPLRVEGSQEVELNRTPHGRATLAVRAARPSVEEARWSGDELVLTGRWPAGSQAGLVLVSRDAAREKPLPTEVRDGRFSMRLRPAAMPTLAGDLPLTQGGWVPVVRTDGEDHPLTASTGVLATLPLRRQVGAKPFTLSEDGGRLELLVGPDLFEDERGAANQLRLRRQEFPRFLAAGLREEVLFESYESRAYADNARAVLEELKRRDTGLACRWVVVDGQTALPPGVDAVRRGSRDYYEALARARYVVVPNYRPLEPWFESPPGQVVVQTWHGAPFKKIGLDNSRGAAYSSGDYDEMLRRETSRWDFLLSPNPTSTPILRRAFAYDGQMLETGYPRTDVFFSADREQVAARVRERLAIPAGKRVVLYVPTMRDDQNYGGNRFSLDLRLDLAAAREALGDDHVLLLRRHAKVVDSIATADGEFTIDVSLWPDVNELLLATDVLVTDYSSLMFDFANTGRPMLFFTYDLADYRDRLRGLYFDAARMPGPHLSTSDEVVQAVREADALRAEYDTTYRAFVEEFCVWDDGGAAARFVDRVFGPSLP